MASFAGILRLGNQPINTIDTAEVRSARLETILERLKALEPKPVEHSAPAAKWMPVTDAEPSAESTGVTGVLDHQGSAWAEAVRIGTVRARRKAQGLDVSVRAIAIEVGCSRGHAGDCLKIREAFNDTLLHFIGENDSRDDGRARLARLSFRTLRSLARLPTGLARIRAARQLSNAAQVLASVGCRSRAACANEH